MNFEGVEVRILAENQVYRSGLIAEHGLSFWINYGAKNYLFDVGQGLVLKHNAKELGLDLSQLDGVILSHGHYDHGGGMEEVMTLNSDCEVYGHPGIFIPKYVQHKGKLVNRSMSISKEKINNFIPVTEPKKIDNKLWLTGEIPRNNSVEFPPTKYQSGYEGNINKDLFNDDQAMFIESEKGLVILLGCSHSGVVNTIEYIKDISNQNKIHAIIGGMHLIGADDKKIDWTIDYLAQLNFDLLLPLHCTGFKAVKGMIDQLGDKVQLAKVSNKFSFLA